MSEATQTAVKPTAITTTTTGELNAVGQFELLQRQANMIAKSDLIPKEYQGNVPNCFIAMDIADRLGANRLMVMQNLYIIHGKPSWSSKFLIASFNQCGRFESLKYEFTGDPKKDDWTCRANAVERKTGEVIFGPAISIAMARAEGWVEKAGSKWKTIPELMLMYRAASFLINTHAPEISMGLGTIEEVEDVGGVHKTANVATVKALLGTVDGTVEPEA